MHFYRLIIIFITSEVYFSNSETTFTSSIPDELFLQPLVSRENASHTGKATRPSKSSTLLAPIIHHNEIKEKVESQDALCYGACITSKACDYHGGTPRGYCSSGPICCQFERTCGGVSSEKISFFQSPHYPTLQNGSLDCNYEVYPNEDTCALRVEFLSFKLRRSVHYSKTEKCLSDALYLLNTKGGYNEPFCDMENHTVIVFVNNGSIKPVKFVIISQSEQFNWNLKITQVNCNKVTPWKNEPKCGRQLMYEESSKHENSAEEEEYSSKLIPNKMQLQPYIVNGKDAENREFPWQISLQSKGKSSHRCGGSIINQRFILTAAHCVLRNAYESKGKMKVIIGDYMLNGTDEVEHEELEIDSIIGHFHYKPQSSHLNDIALLKVAGTIKYSTNIQPICLPTANFSSIGKKGWVSGWGRLNGTDPKASASTLQKLQVSILNDEDCRNLVQEEIQKILHRNISSSEAIHIAKLGNSKTQLCAQAKLNSAVCFGDSGGPLVVQNEDDGSYLQVGVVSYGLGKCITERNPPAAYTKVSEFLDFLSIATSEQ